MKDIPLMNLKKEYDNWKWEEERYKKRLDKLKTI
jgi:hypothetical protein